MMKIKYYDDKKEKHQSHEHKLNLYHGGMCGSNADIDADIEINSYGYDKESSLSELKSAFLVFEKEIAEKIAEAKKLLGIDEPVNEMDKCMYDTQFKINKNPKWRTPTDEDAKKRPKCRVRNSMTMDWSGDRELIQVNEKADGRKSFYTRNTGGHPTQWNQCQILDESAEETDKTCVSDETKQGKRITFTAGKAWKGSFFHDIIACRVIREAQQKPTLEQQIKAQFEGKRITMTYESKEGELKIRTREAGKHLHVAAPSLKGFAGFVYAGGEKFMIKGESVIIPPNSPPELPVACLFTKG